MNEYTVEIEIPPLVDGTCDIDCPLNEGVCCKLGWDGGGNWLNIAPTNSNCPRYKDLPKENRS